MSRSVWVHSLVYWWDAISLNCLLLHALTSSQKECRSESGIVHVQCKFIWQQRGSHAGIQVLQVPHDIGGIKGPFIPPAFNSTHPFLPAQCSWQHCSKWDLDGMAFKAHQYSSLISWRSDFWDTQITPHPHLLALIAVQSTTIRLGRKIILYHNTCH